MMPHSVSSRDPRIGILHGMLPSSKSVLTSLRIVSILPFYDPKLKYLSVSEFGYGVSILNDYKYGYAVQGNVMRLSLLRSPTSPDPGCDQGRQEFSFAVYPHKGAYNESDVMSVAHAFNNPLHGELVLFFVLCTDIRPVRYSVNAASGPFAQFPFVIRDAPNVMLESIKRGEADFDPISYTEEKKKTVILRMFEHMGGEANVTLQV